MDKLIERDLTQIAIGRQPVGDASVAFAKAILDLAGQIDDLRKKVERIRSASRTPPATPPTEVA